VANSNKKVALITGASSGIGEAMAKAYAKRGWNLVLAARNRGMLESVAQACTELGATCKILELDLTKPEQVAAKAREAVDCFGHIHALINNAGVSQRGSAADTGMEVVRKIMEINFFGAVGLTAELLPELRKNQGKVVVVSSFAGLFGFPLRSSYAASKFALTGYFETLGLEEKDITVTLAYPGRIKTNISLAAVTATGDAHGVMDTGQLNGIDVNVCAQKIINAAEKGKKTVLIARGERILYFFKKFCPPLFYYLAVRIKAK
jgi:short-subunit dehydrogenase